MTALAEVDLEIALAAGEAVFLAALVAGEAVSLAAAGALCCGFTALRLLGLFWLVPDDCIADSGAGFNSIMPAAAFSRLLFRIDSIFELGLDAVGRNDGTSIGVGGLLRTECS